MAKHNGVSYNPIYYSESVKLFKREYPSETSFVSHFGHQPAVMFSHEDFHDFITSADMRHKYPTLKRLLMLD